MLLFLYNKSKCIDSREDAFQEQCIFVRFGGDDRESTIACPVHAVLHGSSPVVCFIVALVQGVSDLELGRGG